MQRPSPLRISLFLASIFCASSPLAAGGGVQLEARVSLERGRALLVDESGVGPLKRHEGTRRLEGPGHLELAPGAVARLSWPGLGSTELMGPTSVSWDVAEATEELRLRFGVLERMDLELRRGSVRLDLPGAWRLEAQRGVFELRAQPVGGVGVRQLAGRSCRASWVGGAGVSAPQWIGPGESVRLSGTRVPRPQGPDGAGAPSWNTATWPWGEGGVPGAPDLAVGAEAWQEPSWPWGAPQGSSEPWARWDWPWAPEDHAQASSAPDASDALVREEGPAIATPSARAESAAPPALPTAQELTEELPEALSPAAAVQEPLAELQSEAQSQREVTTEVTTSPSHDLLPSETPGQDVPSDLPTRVEHDAGSWRGLDKDQLVVRSGGTLQLSESWVDEELEGGRRRISIPVDAGTPLWYFSEVYDYRLFPGAELLVDEHGDVLAHQGWVRIFHAQQGRVGARVR